MNTSKSKICMFAILAALVSGGVAAARPSDGRLASLSVSVAIVAPEFYVWDGIEFVGEVNGGFVFLDPEGVWVPCDHVRLERFDAWTREHRDWREHEIRFDRAHRPDRRAMRRAFEDGQRRESRQRHESVQGHEVRQGREGTQGHEGRQGHDGK